MVAEQRKLRILELVRVEGFASLEELATHLRVSESTVRRDIAGLEAEGKLKRTHGGVLLNRAAPENPHFLQHQTQNRAQKRAIAALAASMVQDHDTILLDGGSTTYELGLRLVGRNLQIVTNSLPLANLFSRSESTDLTLVGGHLYARTGVMLGPLAQKTLQQIHCRWAFLSVAGLDDRQLYNDHQLLVETERTMMESADRVVILADSSKFGRKGMFRLCEWDRVHQVIVDHQLSSDWINQLTGSTELLVAEGAEPEPSEATEGPDGIETNKSES